MSFTWFTSNVGYPNFFKTGGDASARAFLLLAQAANEEKSYKVAKVGFTEIAHSQVETKKSSFQEAGLLFVVPRTNRVRLTPLGEQISEWCSTPAAAAANRSAVLLALGQALARHQFDNPNPVGSPLEFRRLSRLSDVRPYLASFYLLVRLGNQLTGEEFLGAVCGLARMADLRAVEKTIRERRERGDSFPLLPSVAALDQRTRGNLKSYFFKRLSLGGEIAPVGRGQEAVVKLTDEGQDLIEAVLDAEWPDWRRPDSEPPTSRQPVGTLEEYMTAVVGAFVSEAAAAAGDEWLANAAELAALGDLPPKEFEEGKKQLVRHLRVERNPALVEEAKRLFAIQHGNRLNYEACGFDFSRAYGDRGRGYIEAHHRTPISTLHGRIVQTVAALALVCANCHRMLHRPPWITVEELRQILEVGRGELPLLNLQPHRHEG